MFDIFKFQIFKNVGQYAMSSIYQADWITSLSSGIPHTHFPTDLSNNTTTSNAGEAVDQKELLFITGRNVKYYSLFGKKFDSFFQN